MENQDGDAIIHELAEAASREMEFYRELKRRRMAMSLWKPKAELNSEQQLAYDRSNCDPLVKEVAKTILEEVQYNRNLRRMANRVALFVVIFALVIGISIPVIIVSTVKSGKHK